MSSPAPKTPINPLELQLNVKQNAQDLNSYLKDLQSWSQNVKQKDQALKEGIMKLTKTPLEQRPIRGKPAAPVVLPSSESADQQRFAKAKADGNAAFVAGKYEQALEHYTQCMLLQPTDAISASNRAQALLKLRRYHEAESDATLALEQDPKHVKSLFRRAQARKELRKYAGALQDCESIAKIESTNKPALALLKESQELLQKQQAAKAAASQPIVSSKPVAAAPISVATATAPISTATASIPPSTGGRRMVIQEEDSDDEEEVVKAPIAKPQQPSPAAAVPISPSKPAAVPTTSSVATTSPKAASPATTAPVSPSSISSGSLTLRAPNSAYDFDATFRAIRTDPVQIAEYFKLIPDWQQYATLLKTALDGNMLSSVIQSITQVLLPRGDLSTAFTILRGLTVVPRFNVARMMLDAKDKAAVAAALKEMKDRTANASTLDLADVHKVAKDWSVTL